MYSPGLTLVLQLVTDAGWLTLLLQPTWAYRLGNNMEQARQIHRAGVHQLTVVVVVAVLLVLSSGAAASAGPGAGAACKRGGWQHLVDVNGSGFKNQGHCVAAAVRGRLGVDFNLQVDSYFIGNSTFEFGGRGCPFVFQSFQAEFLTISGLGTGDFYSEGCVEGSTDGRHFPFAGTFALTSPEGGTLTGVADGVIEAVDMLVDLTFTVSEATGSFAGASGTVHLVADWNGSDRIAGSLVGSLT